LVIHLARFTLDWDTLQRVKIYDRVSFPFVLNMNDYIKGYEGIQNKLYEKEVARMRQYCSTQIDKNRSEEEKRAAKRAHKASADQKDDPKTTEVASSEAAQMEQEDLRMQEQVSKEAVSGAEPPKRVEKGVKINV
jgi:ubiquitin carboxyl-terminal hydrolase 47